MGARWHTSLHSSGEKVSSCPSANSILMDSAMCVYASRTCRAMDEYGFLQKNKIRNEEMLRFFLKTEKIYCRSFQNQRRHPQPQQQTMRKTSITTANAKSE